MSKEEAKKEPKYKHHRITVFDRERTEEFCKQNHFPPQATKRIMNVVNGERMRYPQDKSAKIAPLDIYEWLALSEYNVPAKDIEKRDSYAEKAKMWVSSDQWPEQIPWETRVKMGERKAQEELKARRERDKAAMDQLRKEVEEQKRQHEAFLIKLENEKKEKEEQKRREEEEMAERKRLENSAKYQTKQAISWLFCTKDGWCGLFSILNCSFIAYVFREELFGIVKLLFLPFGMAFLLARAMVESCFNNGTPLLGILLGGFIFLYTLLTFARIFF